MVVLGLAGGLAGEENLAGEDIWRVRIDGWRFSRPAGDDIRLVVLGVAGRLVSGEIWQLKLFDWQFSSWRVMISDG